MIGFADFAPRMLEESGFFKSARYESFEAALDAANQWVAENELRVINVETVVLPNMWDSAENGTEDPEIWTSGDISSNWYQFIRVWYEYSLGERRPTAV